MPQPERPTGIREVTQLLQRWRGGDEGAYDRLFSLLYDNLRGIARRHMQRENPGHTLQATALVNEAYGRMSKADIDWQDSAHFLAIASKVMRRMLVDHARGRGSAKRGGGAAKISLDDAATLAGPDSTRLLDLEDALQQLGRRDPRKEQVVELHFFGGLTQPQIAAALGVSAATVDRDLRMAKAWLKREVGAASGPA